MTTAVRYLSRGGNTKKLAESIADALGTQAQDLQTPLPPHVDLLFLGGAMYGFAIDPAMEAYIKTLSPQQVGKAAVFSTSAISKTVGAKMKQALQQRGIPVEDKELRCKGEFTLMNKGRPNEKDLEEGAAFARQVAGQA